MTVAAVEFEPSTHTYRVDGEIVPSITQVIGASNLWDDSHWSEESAERGRYVHKAVELEIAGKLRQTVHDDRLSRCISSWRRFRNDNPGEVVASEAILHDPVLRFAGRVDVLYRFEDWSFGVIDIKTGQPQPWHAYQTAAQARLILANKQDAFGHPTEIKSLKRWTLYLNETRYRVSVHNDPNDWAVFQSALNLAHSRTNTGKAGEGRRNGKHASS